MIQTMRLIRNVSLAQKMSAAIVIGMAVLVALSDQFFGLPLAVVA
jgi:hypothetical protein